MTPAGEEPAPSVRRSDPTVPVASDRPPSPFRSRAFRVYWAGGLLSNTRTWLYNVTASVVMFELTGSPFMVGVLNFANFAPVFVFSFLAGVLADRVDRRRVVVVGSLVSGLTSAVLTAVATAGRTGAWMLLAVSFTLGTSYAFAKPAMSALLPALVDRDRLAHATAVNTLQFTLGQATGSLLSALLLATAGPAYAFGINALTYLAPVVAMLLLRPYVVQGLEVGRSGLAALRDGLRFVARESGLLRVVAAIVFANGIVESLRTLAPVITGRALALSADEAGFLVGAIGVGSVLGALSFGRVSRWLAPSGMARMGFGCQTLGAVVTATAASLPFAVLGAVVIGTGFSYLIPQLNATMQDRAPDVYRGRVMAAFSMAHLGLRPIWSVLAGWLAASLGSRAALAILVGAAALGITVLRGGRTLDTRREVVPTRATAGG